MDLTDHLEGERNKIHNLIDDKIVMRQNDHAET